MSHGSRESGSLDLSGGRLNGLLHIGGSGLSLSQGDVRGGVVCSLRRSTSAEEVAEDNERDDADENDQQQEQQGGAEDRVISRAASVGSIVESNQIVAATAGRALTTGAARSAVSGALDAATVEQRVTLGTTSAGQTGGRALSASDTAASADTVDGGRAGRASSSASIGDALESGDVGIDDGAVGKGERCHGRALAVAASAAEVAANSADGQVGVKEGTSIAGNASLDGAVGDGVRGSAVGNDGQGGSRQS